MRQMAGRIEFTVFQRSHRLPRETGRSRKSLDTRAFRHSYAIDGRIKDCVLIDPACGSGGFLVESLRYVWNKLENKANELGWPESEIEAEKQKVAIKNFRGIDKDSFLSKVAKAYLAILGDGRGGVHCENSLEHFDNWSPKTIEDIQPGTFDIIVTNPPLSII